MTATSIAGHLSWGRGSAGRAGTGTHTSYRSLIAEQTRQGQRRSCICLSLLATGRGGTASVVHVSLRPRGQRIVLACALADRSDGWSAAGNGRGEDRYPAGIRADPLREGAVNEWCSSIGEGLPPGGPGVHALEHAPGHLKNQTAIRARNTGCSWLEWRQYTQREQDCGSSGLRGGRCRKDIGSPPVPW